MKKIICLLFVVLLLCGCGKNKDDFQTPVNFYYTNTEITYNAITAVLSPEVREGAGYKENLVGLLDLYLAGPLSDEFTSPFPTGTIIKSAVLEKTILKIELSKAFADLTGLDLTIACACLTNTASELTGCGTVNIYVDGTMLDGNVSITMDADDLLLLDKAN